MKLAWGAKVDESFRRKILKICFTFKWSNEHASWLMACIAFETGESFNASTLSRAGSRAVGLIQFMPTTAHELGVTTDGLARMTEVEQLNYVAKYMQPYAPRIKSLSDMYTAIFAPKYIGYPEDTVLYSEGAAYRLNAPLDRNSDGKITKREAAYFVEAKLAKGFQYGNWTEEQPITTRSHEALTALQRARDEIAAAEALLQ